MTEPRELAEAILTGLEATKAEGAALTARFQIYGYPGSYAAALASYRQEQAKEPRRKAATA